MDDDLLIQQFDAAIRAIVGRTDVLPKAVFAELERAAKARAFTVARVADMDVLHDLHKYSESIVATGGGWRDFLDGLNASMEGRGWGGLEPWHAKLVYETNVGMAYSAGRFDTARRSGATHWRYLGSDAAVPREEHKAFYDKVYVMGDGPMPPLDFGCQCSWEPVFDDELDGVEVQDAPVAGGFFAPADFFKPVEIDLGKYPPELQAALKRQAGIDENLKLVGA